MPPIKLELTEPQADALADVLEYYKLSDYDDRARRYRSREDFERHLAEVRGATRAIVGAQIDSGHYVRP